MRSGSIGSADGEQGEQGGWVRRFTECQAHFTHWWPLLTGLAALVGDNRLAVGVPLSPCSVCAVYEKELVSLAPLPFSSPPTQVRTRALDVLFGLLRDYGPGFSASFWALVYRGVLLPLFDDVRHLQNPSPLAGGAGRSAAVARATKAAAVKEVEPQGSDSASAAEVDSAISQSKEYEL